jgi:peptide/nickel transport system substrate-binding protein
VPNPYYYDTSRQYWGKVIATVITTPSSMLEAMQAGQIDVGNGDLTTVQKAGADGLGVTYHANANLVYMMNTQNAPELANLKVRQAMNYAINRKLLARTVGGKYVQPGDEIAGGGAFVPKYQNYYPYDPAKAKELLAAAGYPNGFAIPVMASGSCAGSAYANAAAIIAQDLSAVGITITKIEPCDSISQWGQQISQEHVPLFSNPDTFVPEQLFFPLTPNSSVLTNGGESGFNDPVVNRLAAKANVSSNPNKWWKLVTIRLVKQAYFLAVGYTPSITYFNPKTVKDVVNGQRPNGPNPLEWKPAK